MLQRDCLLEWRNILSNTLFGLEIKEKNIKENEFCVDKLNLNLKVNSLN